MRHLNILVWNDNSIELDNWSDTITKGGALQSNILTSTNTNPSEVAEHLYERCWDLVVLDVVCGGQPVGLDIARAIRSKDPFIPVIAVTRYPAQVYNAEVGLEECALSGIYDASVIQDAGVFREVAVRQSLNHWYGMFPECALVRRAKWELEKAVRSGLLKGDYAGLVQCLNRLPYSKSIDAWHTQLCGEIGKLLGEHGLTGTAELYSNIVSTFQTADPYFMAAKLGRRHLSHNIQVYLLGMIILLSNTDVREYAIRDIESAIRVDSQDALNYAILTWSCIGTSHDVAYLSQYLGRITESLSQVANKFHPYMPEGTAVASGWEWPDTHHSDVGSAMWRSHTFSSELETLVCTRIADAVARHDSSLSGREVVDSKEWASYLAVLCDELQDWHRERHEQEPGKDLPHRAPWRLFTLESLNINRAANGKTSLKLNMMIRDYPKYVADKVGSQGQYQVVDRFEQILSVLKKNLKSEAGWKVHLSADFVMRKVELAEKAVEF